VYCDFAVTVSPSGDLEGWAGALAAELALLEREGLFALEPRLDTLYVGGGTPSLLGTGAMSALAELLGPERLGGPGFEWTAEANPESFTAEVAVAWRRAGVNRVSLGAQTFHAPALAWMGRLHGPEGIEAAVRTAKAAGFDNVSVDLVFALPAHLGRSWHDDLERVLALEVPHVSLYGLGVEPGTPLGRAVSEGREPAVDEEQYCDEFLEASERLRSAGYAHYEVSNFARPGFESRHNQVYWDGRPYLGLGNGSHSYAHPLRRWNVRDWAAYRDRVLAGTSPEDSREWLDDQARALERVWLGLRTARGICLASLGESARARAEAWVREGRATVEDGRLVLTPLGWLELDTIAVELDAHPAVAAPAVGSVGTDGGGGGGWPGASPHRIGGRAG
jgi:oxygen-independent coproporphyrinogen-3 oxidase